MAHFIQVENNKCIGPKIVVNNEVLENKEFPESEPIGIAFCKSLYGEDTQWLQTSYSGSFRGTYACAGMIYDQELDEFKYPEVPTE